MPSFATVAVFGLLLTGIPADLLGAQADDARERERRSLLADPGPRDAASPEVVAIAPVAPDLLAVTIRAGEVIHRGQEAYEARAGDRTARGGPQAIMWEHGEVVEAERDLRVYRPDPDGEGERFLGALAIEADMVHPDEGFRGRELTALTADQSAAYRLVATDGGADYAEPAEPQAVHRKSAPVDRQQRSRGRKRSAMRHTVFLRLPRPLREGGAYELRFPGINTRQEAVAYRHAPRATRSPAVHVNQIGFRGDDPYKRAFLSIWLGTGGAVAYPVEDLRFHLIDETSDETVHSGPVVPAQAADETGTLRGDHNHQQTHVYRMDFAAFRAPGRYRVYVEGVGCSYPFDIADDVWERAWRVSMQGLLHQRSGIALGPPLTGYVRPRGFHPADGLRQYQVDAPTGEAAAIKRAFHRDLADGSLDLPPVDEVWGGYMDAGDWDRNGQHLRITYLQLELLELFPGYFRSRALRLPPEEAGNDLPDLLDEALWNLAFFKRLQTASGGVRSGVESTSHPRKGEASWQESLLVGVFAEQPAASYDFAACAAKLAHLVGEEHPELAATWRPAAITAWDWAVANQGDDTGLDRRTGQHRRRARLAAAVELYRLTGEADYHDAFRRLLDAEEDVFEQGAVRQQDALFTYARLGDDLADPELRERCREAIVRLGHRAAAFARGNAYDIALDVPDLPLMGYLGIFTVPGSISRSLPRAHHLSGDEELLAAAIGATGFTLGANPADLVFTTGLGHNPVRHPLHIDSRVTGQPAPAGLTVYGPSDPRAGFDFESWVHTWNLQEVVPDSRRWPVVEAYHDIHGWPSSCEYTVHQTIGPVGYHWGYLAARGRE